MMTRSRILCISPVFVPIADSEAFCGAKMALALMSDGIDVRTIYMIRNDPRLNGRHEESEFWKPVISASVGVEEPLRKEPITSVIAAFRYMTDCWGRWVARVAEKAAALHRDTPFDIVYSRSLPAIAHVAGFWVSKHLSLPWIANINDPWDFHLFPGVRWKESVVHRIASKFWLRRTLGAADLVTYPSSWLRDYTGNLVGMRHKRAVVPHIGWRAENKPSTRLFTIVHAGKIGVNEMTGRCALGLLKGLRRFFTHHPEAVSTTEVIFVGPSDPQTELFVEQMGFKSVVTFTGWVSYEESLKHIGSATVCILIEAKMARGIYFPLKLSDYIAAGKPVIALSPAIGTVADLANEGGIIRCDCEDEQAIEGAIAELYFGFKNRRLSAFAPHPQLIDRFEPRAVSRLFQELVEDTISLRSKCGRSQTGHSDQH